MTFKLYVIDEVTNPELIGEFATMADAAEKLRNMDDDGSWEEKFSGCDAQLETDHEVFYLDEDYCWYPSYTKV